MKKNNKILTNLIYCCSALLVVGAVVGVVNVASNIDNPIIKNSNISEDKNLECNNYSLNENAIVLSIKNNEYSEHITNENFSENLIRYNEAISNNHNSLKDLLVNPGLVFFSVDSTASEYVDAVLEVGVTYSVSVVLSCNDFSIFNDYNTETNEGAWFGCAYGYDYMGDSETAIAGSDSYEITLPVNSSCSFSEFDFFKIKMFDMTFNDYDYSQHIYLQTFDIPENIYLYFDSIVLEPIASSVQQMCYTSSNNEDSVEEVADDEEEDSSEEITYIEESPAIDSVLDWTIPR